MEYELYHYGVKGMRWGIRRYQKADGSLTPEGRKRAKAEYKEDNKTAFELGKRATLAGYAAAKSMKRTVKLENKLEKKYAKDPDAIKRSTQSLRKKWDASAMTTAQLTAQYKTAQEKAEKHCKSLVDKYGEEGVVTLAYKDIKIPKGKFSPETFKTINEDVHSTGEYIADAAISVGAAVASTLMGAPVTVITYPRSASNMANQIENIAYRSNLEAQRKAKTESNNVKNTNDKPSTTTHNNSTKTESKRVASIKERVTGKKENGKPIFLMTDKERADFDRDYESRKKTIVERYRKASNESTKQKLLKQIDEMENDYMSIVEQDFWYSDD